MNNKDTQLKKKWEEEFGDELGHYKVPCTCLKGGVDGYERVCQRCGGSEWVIPDDLKETINLIIHSAVKEARENKKCVWCQENKATVCDECAGYKAKQRFLWCDYLTRKKHGKQN